MRTSDGSADELQDAGVAGPRRAGLARSRRLRAFGSASLAALAVLALSASAEAHPGPGHSGRYHHAVCGAVAVGSARCDAQLVTDSKGNPQVTPAPAGYGPSDLLTAYGLTAAAGGGAGETIAIVDAYNDPYIASDLATYRAQYGLPPINCNAGSPCFTKVNQSGGTSYPRSNASWSQEIALDVDMASAICPHCNILLVEASSNSFSSLLTAERYAAAHGRVVTNSWGGSEFSGETSYESTFAKAPVAITASTGDSGYGPDYPAASRYVTAVGGTTLSSTSPLSESAWSGAGSYCSPYIGRPPWQSSATTGCGNRAYADVSADADPNTGVAVYDSYSYAGYRGWLVFGGTSVSAQIVGGVYALAGNVGAGTTMGYGYPYSHDSSSTLNDVTTGSNGSCGTQVCDARSGWDGPTGLGSPLGVGAF